MADAAPSVGIVVVNYNSAAFIEEFCASLQTLDYPSWHLFAIDSGSTDDSMQALERAFPKATYVRRDDNIGFAAGANIGIQHCLDREYELALFLNNDVTI